MSKNIEGKISAKGLKFGIVLSRFNSFIGDKLLDGAKDAILRHDGTDENIHVFRVPGALRKPKGQPTSSGIYSARETSIWRFRITASMNRLR